MHLAVLYLAFDGSLAKRRRASMAGRGWGVYHLHPTGAALTALREFPPDVFVVEAASREGEVRPTLDTLASERHRRGGVFPLVVVGGEAPDAASWPSAPEGWRRFLAPDATDLEVEEACIAAAGLRREAMA